MYLAPRVEFLVLKDLIVKVKEVTSNTGTVTFPKGAKFVVLRQEYSEVYGTYQCYTVFTLKRGDSNQSVLGNQEFGISDKFDYYDAFINAIQILKSGEGKRQVSTYGHIPRLILSIG